MLQPTEGYVLHSYGAERYVHHAVASALTLRRHDARRPIALYCSPEHERALHAQGFADLFERIELLPEEHRSIIGFKHHLYRFMPYDRNLFVDSDIVWGRNPDRLWTQLSTYAFTSTGDVSADVWFGAAKDAWIIPDVLFSRRERTLKRFGLTHLPRALTAMVYAQDYDLTRAVCEAAQEYFRQQSLTHFKSRLAETGRLLESCEWSLAMAMARFDLPVFLRFQGYDSPLLNYYPHTTQHDADFTRIAYTLWCSRSVYDLQALSNATARRVLSALARHLPGGNDHLTLAPLMLHFGDLPFKQPFHEFAERTWSEGVKELALLSLAAHRGDGGLGDGRHLHAGEPTLGPVERGNGHKKHDVQALVEHAVNEE